MTRKSGRFRETFTPVSIGICIAATIVLIVAAVYLIRSVNSARLYNVDFAAIEQKYEGDGFQHLLLSGISLRKGTYDIGIGYVSDAEANIEISLDNDTYLNETMPATSGGSGTKNYRFEIKTGTDRGRIDFSYPSDSQLNLVFISIGSDKPLYYDGLIWGIVLLILIPCIWFGMYFFIHSTHKSSLLVAVVLVIMQIIPFVIQTGLNMGIDTRAHMMRIEGIYYGLLDGQFPAVICPEWNNSYGQVGVLYPNVFMYIPAAFRLMGMSQLGACKLFIFLAIISSAVIALASARSIFKREWQISIAVIIICLDNMHLYNMLGDGRFGGAFLAEMFYPLVVAGLIELLYQNRRKWYLLAYGISGIICCHIMSATIVTFAVMLFLAVSAGRLRDKTIYRYIGRAALLSVGLVLGTVVCFLKFYFSDWGQEKLQWENFVSTLFPRGYLPDDIRYVYVFVLLLICAVCLTILIRKRVSEEIKGSYIIPALTCAVVLVWMSTAAFPWAYLTRIEGVEYYTNMIQDAYRFLSLATCLTAFCIPRLLESVLRLEGKRSYKSKTILSTCVVIGILCGSFFLVSNYEYFYRNSHVLYYDAVIGETEYQMDDYLPAGTRSEWYVSDEGYISDVDAVSSLAYERDGTYVYYSYTNSREGAYVEFPKFYYDGYVAKDEMSEDVEVTKGDKNRTRVYLKVTDTPAVIRMWYHVPWYMTLFCAISFELWIGSLIIVLYRVYKRID